MNSKLNIILTFKESIHALLLSELKSLIYDHQGATFIKFVNIANAIEFLGACLDNHPFIEEGHSATRFDDALEKLFPSKYKSFAKKNCRFYLYEQYRCPFIHQLRPGKKIVVTHRSESKKEGTTHLIPLLDTDQLVLVLEDFYDDLEKACNTIFKLADKGKLPTQKMKEGFLKLTHIENNQEAVNK